MTAAAQAVADFLRQFPDLPPEGAPVYFLLCGEAALTVPGIARRLGLAQSSTARLLAVLAQASLVDQRAEGGRIALWSLAPRGRELARTLSK